MKTYLYKIGNGPETLIESEKEAGVLQMVRQAAEKLGPGTKFYVQRVEYIETTGPIIAKGIIKEKCQCQDKE